VPAHFGKRMGLPGAAHSIRSYGRAAHPASGSCFSLRSPRFLSRPLRRFRGFMRSSAGWAIPWKVARTLPLGCVRPVVPGGGAAHGPPGKSEPRGHFSSSATCPQGRARRRRRGEPLAPYRPRWPVGAPLAEAGGGAVHRGMADDAWAFFPGGERLETLRPAPLSQVHVAPPSLWRKGFEASTRASPRFMRQRVRQQLAGVVGQRPAEYRPRSVRPAQGPALQNWRKSHGPANAEP